MAIRTHKKSKAKKLRGHTTHGFGSMKKNRGAGHRGGRGNAGTGKRGDAKKPMVWSNGKYFGKYGFNSVKNNKGLKPVAITVAEINSYVDEWIKSGVAEKKGEVIVIDLNKTDFEKIISNGMPNAAYEVKCMSATANAVAKIEKMKGKVVTDDAAAKSAEVAE